MDEKYYNGDLIPAIIYVPKDSVSLVITAKILNEDMETMYEVAQALGPGALHECLIDGNEWEAENVKYELTDKGREYLEGLS